MANDIAVTIGADTFAIESVDPYTSEDLDWTATGSRVNAEHEDESARDVELVQVTPNDFASYENVFIGYPIWWGIAAWPIDGFVSGNDFNGKTVIPFCTSASSGLGQSADLLEDIAEGGNWIEGHRFSSGATTQEVASWLGGLGFAS